MKLRNCLFLAATIAVGSSVGATAQTAMFTPGDIVVSTYGNTTSNAYVDGNPTIISLIEFSPAITAQSTPVLTFTLPTTTSGNNVGIVGEYGSSSEGNIQLSGDGMLLTIDGYNAQQAANGIQAGDNAANGTNDPIGTPYSNSAGVALAQSTNTDVSRVAVLIDAFGNVNSSTTFNNLYSTNNPRSLYSANGSTVYISGQGSSTADQGIYYATVGTQNAPTTIYNTLDTRFVQVYNGNLYYSIDKKNKATGVFEFSGLPTSAATATQITASKSGSANLSPEGYYFANATTLYIADTGVPKNGGTALGGIQKWTYNGSSWSLAYAFPNPSNFVSRSSSSSASSGETGFEAIAGKVVNGVAYLYAVSYTAGDANANGLYGITDTVSATTLGSQTFTEIAAAPGIQASGNSPDYVFKGVSFAPQAVQTNDTPVMPVWGLIMLGALLCLLVARFLPVGESEQRS
jgi:hypothetical protein